MENRLKVWDLHPSSSAGIGFHLRLGCCLCDFMWFHVLRLGDVMLWCCDVAMLWCCRSSHGWEDCPIRSSSSLKRLQAFQKSEWPMISNFNMSLNGLRFAHLAGEKEIQSRLLLMGMESGANCHELKFDFESKQVSSNSNSLNRWRTSNMSPFSACRDSKYSLYPKYVRFNVNGGILAPQTIWDWKKDGNSHPIEPEQIEQILSAEGGWLSTCLSITSALHFRAA